MQRKFSLTCIGITGRFEIAIGPGNVPVETENCTTLIAASSPRIAAAPDYDEDESKGESKFGPFALRPGERVACYWPDRGGGGGVVAVCSSDSTNSGPGVIELGLCDN
jgi:hypothetical protein